MTCPSCHQEFNTFRSSVETCPLCGSAVVSAPPESARPAATLTPRPQVLASRPGLGYALSCLWLFVVGVMMFAAWMDLWGFSTEPLEGWRGRAALGITALAWVLALMAAVGMWAVQDWGRWLGVGAMVITGATFIARVARESKTTPRDLVLGAILVLINLAVIWYLIGPAARLFGESSPRSSASKPTASKSG